MTQPQMRRLIDAAPESFIDLRHGQVALAIRACNGELTRAEVARQLGSQLEAIGGSKFLAQLSVSALPPDLAEIEAERLWEAYELRRTKGVLNDGLAAIEASPNKVEEIARGVRTALDESRPGSIVTAKLLEARRFDPHVQPPPLRPVYTLAGQVVATPGNIATITSAIKTGKSAVIGALAASAMSGNGDFLGFSSSNPEGKALLWFDSEQSQDDFRSCVSRAVKRAGLSKSPPWFSAYCLTGFEHEKAWESVTRVVASACRDHHGLHSILLDGAADFVADVNDPKECNAFVAKLQKLAIDRDCSIWGVIHFNPGTDKSRGHLGSQLERKAESNLRLDKQGEVTTIWGEKQRRGAIPRKDGPCFQWSIEAGMHMSVGTRREVAEDLNREKLTALAARAFEGQKLMRHSELVTKLVSLGAGTERTAKRKIGDMTDFGFIAKHTNGLYALTTI